PKVPVMEMAKKAKALADELGLTNRKIFFHDGWIEYDDRANFLLDADIAVSAHFDLAETRFSFRTRILDYLWAGLPILTTGGDQLAETIERAGCGKAIAFQNVDGWANAIAEILSDRKVESKMRKNSQALSQEFTWEICSRRLKEYCRNPHHLPEFQKVKMPS